MLLVSGGNGNLARSVIANLLRMTDPGNILVTTRDPDRIMRGNSPRGALPSATAISMRPRRSARLSQEPRARC
jgi:saccharopine dehydrogenase-like NADP-dependent oxidoreductase